jgi:ATP-binding cassette subfamily F protein uup
MAHLADVKQRNSTKSVGVDFVATERETHTLIAAKNVRFVRGEKIILDGVTLNLTKGMRLGLVGLNGTGKTTFLKLLAGDLVPESGTIKRAPDLKCVYFTQNRASLNPSKTLRETFCPLGVDHVVYRDREVHVASWARRFLFRNEALDLTVGRLSGGEQARILIAQLMLQPADVLLLDEPTNDLDIPTLEVLEASLEEFPGAIVLVSHDRFMIDGLSTHILGLDDQGKAQLVADLDQWEREVLRPKAKRPASDAKPGVGLKKSPKKKMTFKEKFEYEQMEATILKAETKLASVHAALESSGQDPARLRTLSQELEAAQQTVDQLYARWAELEKLHEPD